MSLNPSGQIEVAGAYQAEHFAYSQATILVLFISTHVLGRFDKGINKNLIDFFRAKKPSPAELCKGQPLPLLYRHRKTIAQVLGWIAYSVIAGFIVTNSFFINVNVGTDCEFARVTYHEQNFTCFVAFVDFTFAEGYRNGGAKDFDCNTPAPFNEGYYCFRFITNSELDFYTTAETVGIIAALLAPYAFGIQLGAFVIGGALRLVTSPIPNERYRRLALKGLLVVQFLVFFPILTMLLMLSFSDYVLRYESIALIVMVYFQSTLTALLAQIDREEAQRAEELGIVIGDEDAKDDI